MRTAKTAIDVAATARPIPARSALLRLPLLPLLPADEMLKLVVNASINTLGRLSEKTTLHLPQAVDVR